MIVKCTHCLFLLGFLAFLQNSRVESRHRHAGYSCAECSPGYGAIRQCTRHLDTVCSACRPGTYSRHRNAEPCWICSRCGPGLYEYRKCSRTADTICDTCQRAAPGNPDWERKCAGWSHSFLPPRSEEDAKTEQSTTEDPGQLDLEDHSKDGSDRGQMMDPYDYLLRGKNSWKNETLGVENFEDEQEPQLRHERSRERHSTAKTW